MKCYNLVRFFFSNCARTFSDHQNQMVLCVDETCRTQRNSRYLSVSFQCSSPVSFAFDFMCYSLISFGFHKKHTPPSVSPFILSVNIDDEDLFPQYLVSYSYTQHEIIIIINNYYFLKVFSTVHLEMCF